MPFLVDIVTWALLLGGSAFCLIGGIGLLRLPDFFSRIHGAGLTDTLGAGLILIGLMLHSGFSLNAAKLAFILFFLLLTSPTGTHVLAQAAMSAGLKPRLAPEDNDE
jgi:multicomponent Na+:H+ antiporter subunit G